MCGEVVAAPLSLQDTVYPILRKKSLHFCENSRMFLKLCTVGRKKYKIKRLRRKNELPQSKPDSFASSPKGEPLAWRYSLRSNRFKNTGARVAAQGQLFVTAGESKRYGVTAVI